MGPPRTISRYLAAEILLYTVLAFLAAAPVLLVPNVFDHLGEFFVVGVTAADVAVAMGWLIVLIAAYALPIAFAFGLLLAMGRLAGDGEIAALRACGVGLLPLVRPVVAVGVFLSLLAGVVSIGFEHTAWKQIEMIRREVLARGAVIEPGRFQRFGDRTILVQGRRGPNRFEGVMIADHTAPANPMLIFAESADYAFDSTTGMLRLLLANGEIRMDPYPNAAFEEHRISFAHFDYAFLEPWLAGEHWRFPPNQLSFSELRAVASRADLGAKAKRLKYRDPRYYEAHLHRMLAVPVAPALFSLIGIPLAIFGVVRSRAWGSLLALVLLGGYYALFIFAYDAARSGRLPSLPAIWAPDALFLAVAAIGLAAAARSRR